MKNYGWETEFIVYAFSPDGPFTTDELKNYINEGISSYQLKTGAVFRMSPIEVRYKNEETKKS